MRTSPALPVAALAAALLLATLPAAQAQWAVYAEVINDCSETVTVEFSTGGSFTVAYGQSATVTLCESGCTGFLGGCESYDWSYDAAMTSGTDYWSDSSSTSICGLDAFDVTDTVRLTCDDYVALSTACTCCSDDYSDYCCEYGDDDYGASNCPAPSPSPTSCKCCSDYSDYSGCCEYGDSDYGASNCPGPSSLSPPTPAPIPVAYSPPPTPMSSSPSPPVVVEQPAIAEETKAGNGTNVDSVNGGTVGSVAINWLLVVVCGIMPFHVIINAI